MMYLQQQVIGTTQQRINFTILENQLLDDLCSDAARAATTKVAQVYLRLRRAPLGLFESPGAMRIVGNEQKTAWQTLMLVTGVASETMNKALKYLKKEGVIGYWAGKNGTGIRIWFNLAANSVREKNTAFIPASNPHTPSSGTTEDINNLRQQIAGLVANNRRLTDIVNALPDKEWLLSKGLPKLGRVFFNEKSKSEKADTKRRARVGGNHLNPESVTVEVANLEEIQNIARIKLAALSSEEIAARKERLRAVILGLLPTATNWSSEIWEETLESNLLTELASG